MKTILIRRKFTLILIAAALAIAIFYFLFDPAETAWMPQCVFHRLTGLQCMGCGAQRMLHALLHGDLASAYEANALLLFLMPVLILMAYAEIFKKRHPKLYRLLNSPAVMIAIAAILLIWVAVRNLI